MIRNSVFGFRERKFDDIQLYTFDIVFLRLVILYEKSAAEKDRRSYDIVT